uniref:Uncharacterized protein n=1 Tax=Arundo donax TaxID=35708 RepID=A0A0A9AC45_ARUDO
MTPAMQNAMPKTFAVPWNLFKFKDSIPKRTARKKATTGKRLNIADDDVAEA